MEVGRSEKDLCQIERIEPGFLKKYLPCRKQTIHLFIPIVGFSISCVSLGILMEALRSCCCCLVQPHEIYSYGYLTIVASCSYDLYKGLTKKVRNFCFFWIFLKSLEQMLLLVLAAVPQPIYREANWVFPPILFLIQMPLLIYVLTRARKIGDPKQVEDI